MDFYHLFDNLMVSQRVPQPPAGHGKALGKTVDNYGSLFHAGQSGDTTMLHAIGKLPVYFIGYNNQIVFLNDR